MVDKHDVSRILDEIATLLELSGENAFRIGAYRRAARTIEDVDNLKNIVDEGRLEELPGIGEGIAEKVTILFKTGRLPYYEKLKKKIPSGALELLKVPGLGGKKVKELTHKLKIKTLEDLVKCGEQGKIAKIKGFGEKTQNNILQNVKKLKSYGKRMLWWEAMKIAYPIFEGLSKLKSTEKVSLCGSFRRKLETVGDLDFLVASKKPQSVIEWFTAQKNIEKVAAKGPTKLSVRLKSGVQVDLRVVTKEEYPFALVYFTGSKEHNIVLRKKAKELGYKLNEYGLDPYKNTITTEEDVYRALKLPYMEPELRENRGEFDVKLPVLVEEKDLKGAFHCHTTASDGHNSLEEMVRAADELKWEYIGIADHSKSSFQANGLDEERLFEQVEKIRKLNKSKKFGTYIFAGTECDILTDGQLDFVDDVLKELDYVVISIHRSFQMSENVMTKRIIKAIENPYSTMLGHLSGRLLLRREAYAVDVNKVIDACIANGKYVELNAQPMRLDMDWRFWHQAKEKGLKCVINPDAHSASDLLYLKAGINSARKGWLEKGDILNTLTLAKIKRELKKCVG